MPGPKLALTTLTAVLGLTVVVLPQTELDAEAVQRRQVAKRQLAALDEAVQLNRMLIASGAWDVNTLFNIAAVFQNRNHVLRDRLGDCPQLLREYEATFCEVCQLQAAMLDRRRSGTIRRSDCPGSGFILNPFLTDLRELRAKLAQPPGEEEQTARRFVIEFEALDRPTPDDGSARRSLITLTSYK